MPSIFSGIAWWVAEIAETLALFWPPLLGLGTSFPSSLNLGGQSRLRLKATLVPRLISEHEYVRASVPLAVHSTVILVGC